MTAFVWPHPSAELPKAALWYQRWGPLTGAEVRTYVTEREAAEDAATMDVRNVIGVELIDGTTHAADDWPAYEEAIQERAAQMIADIKWRRLNLLPASAPGERVLVSPWGHHYVISTFISGVPQWVGNHNPEETA